MADSCGKYAARPVPSEAYLQVARDIADALGLDAARAIDGEPLEYGGLSFSLRQYGELDPQGLIVAIQTDPVVEGMEGAQCKSLLRQHLSMPPAFAGYYAMSRDEDIILFCFRVDLEKDREPVTLVQALLERALQQRQQIEREFVHELAAVD